MPATELAPNTIAMLKRVSEALHEHPRDTVSKDLTVIDGLLQTHLMIADSPAAESAMITAGLTMLVDFCRGLDSIVSPGERENTQSYLRDIGAETQAVDEEEESLTIAFTKIAALIGRPDVLARRFMEVAAASRGPYGGWKEFGHGVDTKALAQNLAEDLKKLQSADVVTLPPDKAANTRANHEAFISAQVLAGEQLGFLGRTDEFNENSKRVFRNLLGRDDNLGERAAWDRLTHEIYATHSREELEQMVSGPAN